MWFAEAPEAFQFADTSIQRVGISAGVCSSRVCRIPSDPPFQRANCTRGKDFLVAYVTLSALNFAVSGFLIPTVNSIALASEWRVFAWALYVFAMPFIIGVVLGALIQRGALIWLFSVAPLRYIGVKPINHIPTAWDWKFGQTSEQFILIILKDGTQFSGLLGTDSFISSHPSERDLYVQSVYELDEKGNWLATEKSLYVASGEIRTVEFWPVS